METIEKSDLNICQNQQRQFKIKRIQVSKANVYTADFETTSLPNLQRDGRVRVWLWSLVNVETKQAFYGYDIESFLKEIKRKECVIIYFHNLKFDGSFLTYYFLEHNIKFELTAPNGQWFSITWGNIEFRDSLKKFKMTVEGLAIFLGIEHKKSVRDENDKNTWDYYIPEGYCPTPKEIDYCVHDSRIVAYAIEKEWDAGRKRLTSSSEAYHNCKNTLKGFNKLFPKLSDDDDAFIRKSYKGGVCAVNPVFQGKVLDNVYSYDVNGLYGSVMDECVLPFGQPYDGEPVNSDDLYVVNFYCTFHVRDGFFPMLQIKKNVMYANRGNEYLTESNGLTNLTLTSIDYELFKKHYEVENEFGHIYKSFRAKASILSPIIQENLRQKSYYSEPEHSDSYRRQIAKDNTNMLYGSFGLSTINDDVHPYLDENGIMKFAHERTTKQGRYIPMATFITAQARKKTITAIQANYKNWVYSDTDSMYLLAPAKGIEIHPTQSGKWGFDSPDDNGQPYPHGKFLRQKTYALADENFNIYRSYDKYGKLVSELKCAGMPAKINETITWNDFKLNECLGTRLQSTLVKGGTCLIDREFGIYDL